MLEALQDIEIASRLVGFDAENDDSIDDKYKKLHCCINPLPHDSEDYRLIEKYLLTTHAPTHKVGFHYIFLLSSMRQGFLFSCVNIEMYSYYNVAHCTKFIC